MKQTEHTTRDQHADTILEIDSLDVEFATESGPLRALRDVSLSIESGEVFGIAGESGSGKSTLALTILRYLASNGRITDGTIHFKGRNLLELSGTELQSIRGNEMAHCAQDPEQALNPSIRVGEQIAEVIRTHYNVSDAEATRRTEAVLADVNLPDPAFIATKYPHELSGGMQQRVLIAMSLACEPDLLILDEPTTGLDVTTQAKILGLIERLQADYNTSIILITHNLGVITEVADRVAILYAGEVVEHGRVRDVFREPANPYTKALMEAVPETGDDSELDAIPGKLPDLTSVADGCIFADRCAFVTDECRDGPIPREEIPGEDDHWSKCIRWETVVNEPDEAGDRETGSRSKSSDREPGSAPLVELSGVKKHFDEPSFLDRFLSEQPPVKAVDGVDLSIAESETLGIVGESGCGKSTLAKTVLQLLEPTDGTVSFDGVDISTLTGAQLDEFRSRTGIVFQNPHSSLNPRKTVHQILDRQLRVLTELDGGERDDRILELLQQVNLGGDYASRYPHELSGGEMQRVAIARAFAANPDFVVLDEPVSALDVSVQASILNLLQELRAEYGSSYLFISHDLGVVNHISDRVAVMYLGEVVEVGPKESVFEPPYHPYTKTLLSSVPSTDPDEDPDRITLAGDVPSARNPPSGCSFHTRCPQKIGAICETDDPELAPPDGGDGASDHCLSCHLAPTELSKPIEDITSSGTGESAASAGNTSSTESPSHSTGEQR